MKVKEEYDRIRALFDGCDEKQLALIDGAIVETARLKVELDMLHEIVEHTGLIKVNPKNPMQQMELPVARKIVQVRANYLNYISKLSNILGKSMDEDDEDYLKEFE